METRSYTHYQNSAIYEVDIDFDGAIEAWNANKKKLANGCYQYICGVCLKNGGKCTKKPCKNEETCSQHRNK